MARGAISKEKIMNTILETFPGAFKWDKEIRIPMEEDGELIQIKCTLTAAKTNVENTETKAIFNDHSTKTSNTNLTEPSEEEKRAVEELIAKLGINNK